MTTLKVGGASVDFDEAKVWATEYLVGRIGASAYPAYDGYPGSDSDFVAPQDLLAVALLNVSNKPLKVSTACRANWSCSMSDCRART